MPMVTPPPKIQFFDANGNPLVGGKLYTYASGTTTPLATYTDWGALTPNSNPVILDSRGEASVWLSDNVYTLYLTSAAGVAIWSVDHISGTSPESILASFAASGGSALVGYLAQGAGAVVQTLQTKVRGYYPTIRDFGSTDTTAVSGAESCSSLYIDLQGLTITTTAVATTLTKNYFNGTLIAQDGAGHNEYVKLVAPVDDMAVQRPRTKSPFLAWTGANVLWLGTSLPHQGAGTANSYPELFGQQLGCNVVNNAWATSAARYNVAGSSSALSTVLALSMTADDVAWGLATYGGSSCYSDTFDAITKASQMTCDYRIKIPFSQSAFDVVVLDHNINDSGGNFGSLSPEYFAITAVSKGTTTTFTLAPNVGTLVVGDSIYMTVTGIPYLNHAAGRVQSISGSNVVLNINSSGYSGTFSTGTAYKADRNTVYGAYEFLINYIYWSAIVNTRAAPKIVLSSCPSNYEYGAYDTKFWSIGEAIKQVAVKWDLSFFDINQIYDIKLHDQLTYFPDTVHPTTLDCRQSIVNYWVNWASGGAVPHVNLANVVPWGAAPRTTDQREALYSDFLGGFATPNYIVGAYSLVESETWVSGSIPAGWTASGTAPTYPSAPWGGGGNSLLSTSDGSSSSYIYKAGTYGDATAGAFEIYLSSVTGLAPAGTVKSAIVFQMLDAGGAPFYVAQLVITSTGVSIQFGTFLDTGGVTFQVIPGSAVPLVAATKTLVNWKAVRAGTGRAGAVVFYVGGVKVATANNIADTQTVVSSVWVGLNNVNTGQALSVYYGNISTGKATVYDYSTRYTGTVYVASTSGGSPTHAMTIVNGIITAVA